MRLRIEPVPRQFCRAHCERGSAFFYQSPDVSQILAKRDGNVLAMSQPTLYTYWRSSCSYRVRIALNAKRIAYTPVFVNLVKGEQKSESFREKNPMGYLPCLVVDDEPIFESVAICEYLEERFPEIPLLPKDPVHRSRVRSLMELVNAGVQPLQNLNVLERVSSDQEKRKEWAAHFNAKGLTAFEGAMESFAKKGAVGKFAYGDSFTLADAFLVPQVYSAKRFGVDLSGMPRVSAAYAAALETPWVPPAIPENQLDHSA